MADGFIVRKGGVTTEQALAPTITEVSTDVGEIVFTLTNNDTESAVILYETNDEIPDKNSIELAGGATSGNLTITGLTVSPAILYASANVVGKVKSNITERSFTFTVLVYTAATGGTTLEYDDGGKRFKSHTFTSDGNFVVSTVGNGDRNQVDYLIIAGGGSGGAHNNTAFAPGGGGAGGYQTTLGTSGANSAARAKVTVTAQSFSIDVGAGGTAVTTSTETPGNAGSASTGLGVSTVGGGRGAAYNQATSLGGGSGGGGSFDDFGTTVAGAGTALEGFAGGIGSPTASGSAGGGGGAGEIGNNGDATVNGKGGDGLSNTLRTGSAETRAGGGGGGFTSGFTPVDNSGAGGGGRGAGNVTFTTATAGTVNTGSGGGGARQNASGAGGSGIVVIRYEIAPSV